MGFESYKFTFRINASHANVNVDEGVHSHTFEISLYIKQKSKSFTAYDITENVIQNYLKPYSGVVLNRISHWDKQKPQSRAIRKCLGKVATALRTERLAKVPG